MKVYYNIVEVLSAGLLASIHTSNQNQDKSVLETRQATITLENVLFRAHVDRCGVGVYVHSLSEGLTKGPSGRITPCPTRELQHAHVVAYHEIYNYFRDATLRRRFLARWLLMKQVKGLRQNGPAVKIFKA